MRGRLFMAGVRARTALTDVLDLITVIVMDTPGEALAKWRSGLDRAVAVARMRDTRAQTLEQRGVDRASWGLAPHQVEATRRFMTSMGGGGSPSLGS